MVVCDLVVAASATPAELLGRRGRRLSEAGVGVELNLTNAALPPPPELPSATALRALRAALAASPAVSAHGPHEGLDLVADDPVLAAHARASWERALTLCSVLGVDRMVVHSGLPFRRDPTSVEAFFERFTPVLAEMALLAAEEGVTLLLENTTEPAPDALRSVFEALPEVGFCFDPAHARAFAVRRDPAAWLRELGAFWEHLHLSGTRAGLDLHLPLLDGEEDPSLPLASAPDGMRVVLETHPFRSEDVAWIAALRRDAPWLRSPSV